MKRGGPTHPKTFALAEELRFHRRYEAVGLLELLFHFTAQYAPQGDIGRFSDKRIAAALDWTGYPSRLVEALVKTGWLDRHETARLVVHDWADHADRATLQRLKRDGLNVIQSGPSPELVSAPRGYNGVESKVLTDRDFHCKSKSEFSTGSSNELAESPDELCGRPDELSEVHQKFKSPDPVVSTAYTESVSDPGHCLSLSQSLSLPVRTNRARTARTNRRAPSRSKSEIDPEILRWFDGEFWPAYPRKEGRLRALESAILKATSAELRAFYMERLKTQLPGYQQRKAESGQSKIPMACTWFNQDRAHDEIEVEVRKTGHQARELVPVADMYPEYVPVERPEE